MPISLVFVYVHANGLGYSSILALYAAIGPRVITGSLMPRYLVYLTDSVAQLRQEISTPFGNYTNGSPMATEDFIM